MKYTLTCQHSVASLISVNSKVEQGKWEDNDSNELGDKRNKPYFVGSMQFALIGKLHYQEEKRKSFFIFFCQYLTHQQCSPRGVLGGGPHP